tara:strand:+ start:257 stop:418 length:162 start_codon:yes stop_codon:yes gene_type:complete
VFKSGAFAGKTRPKATFLLPGPVFSAGFPLAYGVVFGAAAPLAHMAILCGNIN